MPDREQVLIDEVNAAILKYNTRSDIIGYLTDAMFNERDKNGRTQAFWILADMLEGMRDARDLLGDDITRSV